VAHYVLCVFLLFLHCCRFLCSELLISCVCSKMSVVNFGSLCFTLLGIFVLRITNGCSCAVMLHCLSVIWRLSRLAKVMMDKRETMKKKAVVLQFYSLGELVPAVSSSFLTEKDGEWKLDGAKDLYLCFIKSYTWYARA